MPCAVVVQSSGMGFASVAGLRLRGILCPALARDLAGAGGVPPPADVPTLFRSRWTDFAAVLGSLPDAVEIALVSNPNTDPRDVSLSFVLAVIGHGPDDATARSAGAVALANVRRLLHMLIDVYEFEDLTSETELRRVAERLSLPEVREVRRRYEEVSVRDGALRATPIGFAPTGARPAVTAPAPESLRHLYPWVPSDDSWARLFEALRDDGSGAALIVRARGCARAPDAVRGEVAASIRAAEAMLSELPRSPRTGGFLANETELLRDEAVRRLASLDSRVVALRVFVCGRTAPSDALLAVVQSALDDATTEPDRAGTSTLFRSGALVRSADAAEVLAPVPTNNVALFFAPREAPAALRSPYASDSEIAGLKSIRSRRILLGTPAKVGVPLGVACAGGRTATIALDATDRFRHTYVIGQTGTGKSTLLLNMILDDIRGGHAVVVLDPHGSLVRGVLKNLPEERVDDVVFVDPTDPDSFVGMNPLRLHAASDEEYVGLRDATIDDFYSVLDRMYDMKSVGGPMFEMYFRGAMALLLGATPTQPPLVPSLMLLREVFANKELRKALVSRGERDPMIESFVLEAERAGGEASLQNIAPYITSKVNRFISDLSLRRMTCQHRSLDVPALVRDRRILLFDLARGRFGEFSAGLLASRMVSMVRDAVMRLGAGNSHLGVFLYVDEFQIIADERFAELLAEARKYRLALTVAHQYVKQLPEDVLNAVMGNVGTMIAMRVGAPDGEFLEPHFMPHLNRRDLAGQPNFHAYVRVTGREDEMVASVELPAPGPSGSPSEIERRVREQTRRDFGQSRVDADREIQESWDAYRELGRSARMGA